MPDEISSRELAAVICALPRPVLFFDTAALLDVLRVPFRQELQMGILESAVSLVSQASDDSREVWLVSTSGVLQEFRSHCHAIGQELAAHVAQLARTVARMAQIAAVVLPEKQIQQLQWLDADFGERVIGIAERLVASTTLYQGSDACIQRAGQRVWTGLPPASISKQEFKDCQIFEEFLELAAELRSNNFALPIAFVTPNSKDYGNPPVGHERISADLNAHGCLYAGNVAWARAMVGLELRRTGL